MDCSRCHKKYNPTYKKNGTPHKMCGICLDSAYERNKSYIRKLCPHNKAKRLCVLCGGSGLCIHGVSNHNCRQCKGSSMCIHEKFLYNCKLCNGSSICAHSKQFASCKLCNDPLDVTIKHIIDGSKCNDKKYNRFDECNFIDREYCEELIASSNFKCCYCMKDVQCIEYNPDLLSIERINNLIGHVKGNVKISCLQCNMKTIGGKKGTYII